MGIFSRIMEKLRSRGSGPIGNAQAGQPPATPPGQQQTQRSPAPTGQMGSPPVPTLQNVDVDAVLAQMAKEKGGGGNYRESIVDLLKLLDLDSDLEARKELARELNVTTGNHGTAEQNIALHKAVMRELAKNGGKVPDSLKD